MNPQLFKKQKGAEFEKESAIQPERQITPEIEPLPEKEREKIKKEFLEEIEKSDKALIKKTAPPLAPPQKIQPQKKSPTLLEIEHILEQDLEDVYFKMEPAVQQKFKAKGEEVAAKIEKILEQTKFKAKEIFKLIVEWLKIIPGVSHFFIKQEAKIKTDEIIKLKNQ